MQSSQEQRTKSMNLTTKILIVVMALGLAACKNPNRYGANGANGAGAATQGGLGDPSNPASPAYFNQTVGDRVLFAVDQSTISDQGRMILAGQDNSSNMVVCSLFAQRFV
jgi:peptidoglycan-associated lipoprotein